MVECNGFNVLPVWDTVSVSKEHMSPFTLPEEVLEFEPDSADIVTTMKSGVLDRRIHGGGVPLKDAELGPLQQLRKEASRRQVAFSPEVCSDATRFLSAAKGDTQKALGFMQATQAWRESFFGGQPLRSGDVAEDLSHGAVYFCGRDRAMRPALVIRANRVPRQWQNDKDNKGRLIKILVFCMEYMLRFMFVPGRVETSNLIIDLKGISTTDIPLGTLSDIHRLFSAHYPCRGFRFYICNVPRMVMFMSSAAKTILTEKQKMKLVVLSDVRELLKEFSPHQLEIDLGGSRPVAKKFLPFPLEGGPFRMCSSPSPAATQGVNRGQAKKVQPKPELGNAEPMSLQMSPSLGGQQVQAASQTPCSDLPPQSATNLGSSAGHTFGPMQASGHAFLQGDSVLVWSASRQAWLPGKVEAYFTESTEAEGFAVPGGTLKVSSVTGVKWIPPHLVKSAIRPSRGGCEDAAASCHSSPQNSRQFSAQEEVASQGRILLSASLDDSQAGAKMTPQTSHSRFECQLGTGVPARWRKHMGCL
eukprot:TRINITY_DN66212_c0_g1_i1.p1 TRINITY_DN66212_c0_g1~~TRINITY_DN66212_c0_g1_i1.p1  ORF type:complete len:543 (+),score=85.24 TRINITY_DN66212_c0_g1_i1:41-1630(+)